MLIERVKGVLCITHLIIIAIKKIYKLHNI